MPRHLPGQVGVVNNKQHMSCFKTNGFSIAYIYIWIEEHELQLGHRKHQRMDRAQRRH